MRASIAPNILSVKIPILPPAKLCESVSQDTESWTPSHSHLFNYVYVDQSLPHVLFLPRIIFFSPLYPPPLWKEEKMCFMKK